MLAFCVFFLAFLAAAQGFRLPVSKPTFSNALKPRHLSPSSLSAFDSVLVADGAVSAVTWPIAISVLTMVPFLYYQQALKPKPRTVKQIELDDRLRPVDKKQRSSGKETEARAKK